jgi:cytochrome c2
LEKIDEKINFIAHQKEHAQEIENFAEEAKTDLNVALEQLYRTAIAYQALAVECGFQQGAAVEAAHELEHSGLFDDNATTTDAHEHNEEEEAAVLARARTIGDPEQGKILFNAVRPEVSFACATCHRADSTETLVGPGLLGISGHTHNHDAAAGSMAGMDMGATATPDSMAGMNMGEATPEAADAPERTFEETVEFLRTSITNPSAEVMTGFPDNLMPKVYGQILTEQEINNLIAYLLTLD